VGLSISVTFMSAITMIGYPTESYGYGSIILWYSISGAIPVIVACVYYIPLIHRLRLTSVYEVTLLVVLSTYIFKSVLFPEAQQLHFWFCFAQYLERRFHKAIRLSESFIFISTTVIFQSSCSSFFHAVDDRIVIFCHTDAAALKHLTLT